jgi:hypothetical protein
LTNFVILLFCFKILGYGILFRVSDDNIKAHANDRKVRIFDESNVIKVCYLKNVMHKNTSASTSSEQLDADYFILIKG